MIHESLHAKLWMTTHYPRPNHKIVEGKIVSLFLFYRQKHKIKQNSKNRRFNEIGLFMISGQKSCPLAVVQNYENEYIKTSEISLNF